MKLRLQAKYAGVIVGLIILITGILSGILLFQFQSSTNVLSQRSAENMSRELMAQMEKRAEATVHFLGDMLTNPLYQYDIQRVNVLLDIVIAQNDVVNALVYDTDGLIVHDGQEGTARFGEPIDDELSLAAISTAGQLVAQVEGNVLSVSLPVWIGETPLGGVKLELSLDGIRGDIEAMRHDVATLGQYRLTRNTWTVVFTTSILVLASIYLGVSVSGRMIKPIRELTENVSRVGRGNYRLRIDSKRSDELGDLIDSFNHMTGALERTTVSKNYVENIIGSMTDTLTVLNADGSIRMVNPAMSVLLGFEPDELVGQPFSRLFPEDMHQTATGWLSDLIEQGVLRQQELAFQTRDGEIVSVSLSGSVMAGEGDRPDAIVCVAQDITERKRTQEALIEAKKNAEEASRTKSAFLAAMSHEIRTPMNGVMGMTDLLLRTKLNERQRRFVGIVHHSAETLLGIINDILDFSRIEAGKLQLDKVAFSLHEVVGNMVELLAESAQSKGLELAYFLSIDTPDDLVGDPNRLRQILINLIGNAIKFTEEGEVVLKVSVLRKSDSSIVLHFEVSDSGIGIDEQLQAGLFDAFQQVDKSISRRYGGTGLGLSIAKQLVELMQGEIGVVSRPDAGSTFHFTAQLGLGVPTADIGEVGHGGLQGARLLVVDDNATNREIIELYAAGWGMCAEAACDGPGALQAIRDAQAGGEPYDAAILDMVMPGMSGLDLAREIKADPAISRLPLMMLTSVGWQDDAREIRDAGVTAIATKPVRQSALHAGVVQLLAPKDPGRAAPRSPEGGEADLAPHGGSEQDNEVRTEVRFDGRILLVEDNAVNCEVAMEHLLVVGCQVDVAANGLEAVEAVRDGSYDLVLMDCQMPVMDGLEATRTLRRREAERADDSHLPIVALSANAFDSDRDACLAAGMDGFLVKPLQASALHKALARWLQAAPATTDRRNQMIEFDGESPDGETGPASTVLDPTALEEIRGLQREGQPDVVAKVVGMYLENSPGLIESLGRNLAAGDLPAVQRDAHTFKSSSASVGAQRLAACCKALELKCREGRVEGCETLVEQLEQEYQAVAKLLTGTSERKAV